MQPLPLPQPQPSSYKSHLLAMGVFAVLMSPLHAADADGQRGIGIFDQHPECMERHLKPRDREKCAVRGDGTAPRLAPRQQAGAVNESQIGGSAGSAQTASPTNSTLVAPGAGDKARGGAGSR